MSGEIHSDPFSRVVLLHGLWMPGVSMGWFAHRLEAAGFEPEIFSYTSIVGGPEAALPRLIETLARAPTHIVAHSLGGLLSLTALQRQPDLPVSRVVCLGSPLRGSAAAAQMARHGGWTAASLGHSAELLQHGCEPWQGTAQIGMIAGRVAHGLGQYFGHFDGDNDGSVAVAETELAGLADRLIVDVSHSGLLLSAEAAMQSVAFLRTGRFSQPTQASP